MLALFYAIRFRAVGGRFEIEQHADETFSTQRNLSDIEATVSKYNADTERTSSHKSTVGIIPLLVQHGR